MKKDHPYNRRPQLAGKGLLPIGMNYALGTGGPAGSELPPPLTGVRCKCGAVPRRVDGLRVREGSMSEKIFKLRCPNGENSGKYFVSADLYDGIVWTADAEAAPVFSMRDAYGFVAAAIDQLAECIVPESCGATEEDCQDFGRLVAKDMFQQTSPQLLAWLVERAARRTADEPLVDVPNLPERTDKGYMSVYEWVMRACYREKAEAQC